MSRNKSYEQRRQEKRLAAINAVFDDKDLLRTNAFHESAHAIVSEDFSIFRSTTSRSNLSFATANCITENPRMIGDPRYNGGVLEMGFMRILASSQIQYAGPAAEYKLGTTAEGIMPTSDIKELLPKIELMMKMTGLSAIELHNLGAANCKTLLDHPGIWAAITELAELLLTEKTVLGPAVREIAMRHASSQFVSKIMQMELNLAMNPNSKPSKEFLAELEIAKREQEERQQKAAA